ncbi:MAG: hypothetical protein AB2421_16620 [Thermotaleaceae bacterium]
MTKTKAMAVLLVLIMLLTINIQTVYGNLDAGNVEGYTEDASGESEGGGGGGEDGWLSGLISIFKQVADAFLGLLDLFLNVATFVKDFIFMILAYSIGLLLDVILIPVLGIFSSNFITSQTMSQTPWVRPIWGFVWLISLSFYGIALLYMARRFIKGERVPDDTIKLFFIVLIINFFSLWITEFVIIKLNEISIGMIQEDVKSVAQALGEGNVKAPYSTNVILKGYLGENYDNEISTSGTYSQYLLQEDYGNTFTMILIMLSVIIKGYLAAFRWVAIRILQIISPYYLIKTAFKGEIEALVGVANLYVRTHLVQIIFAFTWKLSYQINKIAAADPTQFASITPELITGVLMAAGAVIVFKFWCVPTYQAARYAATLNGGAVMDSFGKGIRGMTNSAASVADHFGRADLYNKFKSMADTGENISNRGEELSTQAQQQQREYMEPKKIFANENPLLEAAYKRAQNFTNMVGNNQQMDFKDGKYALETYEISDPSFEDYIAVKVNEDIGNHFLKFIEENQINLNMNSDKKNEDGILLHKSHIQKFEKAYEYFMQNKIYWLHHDGRYVLIRDGRPVLFDNPPEGGIDMGQWSGSRSIA